VARYGLNGNRNFLTCGVMHHNLALFKALAGAQPCQKGQIGLNYFALKVANTRPCSKRTSAWRRPMR